jgi:hypothetical protein
MGGARAVARLPETASALFSRSSGPFFTLFQAAARRLRRFSVLARDVFRDERPLRALSLFSGRTPGVAAPFWRRRCAADRAWRESAWRDAVLRGSRFNAREIARERVADFLRLPPVRPARAAALALWIVFSLARPGFGGGRGTPARRAFDRPIAIAC